MRNAASACAYGSPTPVTTPPTVAVQPAVTNRSPARTTRE
jgi:hypothetical protein